MPFILTSPQGDLNFNVLQEVGTTPLGYYVLDSRACSTGVARRVTRTNIAQAGGEITHRKFKSGYVMELTVQLWETIGDNGVPATLSTLRQMADLLMLHLNAIDNADGRMRWAPSGAPERMLDRVRMLGPSGSGSVSFVSVVDTLDAGTPLHALTFALLSPFPYGMDYSEVPTPTIADGNTATLTNGGNADFYPVLRVNGPSSGFVVTNKSVRDSFGNPLQIVYDTGLPGSIVIPGGGDYAEIDMFRNTVYLNSNGRNLKPGINILISDFWWLAPGDNVISITGASVDVLWQNAYA